ncbi:MAG: threonylcarbamoyl-AMP synthase [Deltaproteobacteria bacterium]|nr:MAG: threonylcarbamoyl-AMP synthase [Deltaproteobacteria bacterium]
MKVFEINERNPQERLIKQVSGVLGDGGVIVYPTDTVYAYGCDIRERHAIERIYSIKKIPRNKPLSFIFSDISQLHEYVRNISDVAFKIMKRAFPGPYTFIFKASKLVPKIAITNQKTIGVRIPDHRIPLALVNALGRPILSASVSAADGTYVIEPSDLEKRHKNEVDIIFDCGPKISDPSTVLDFSDGDMKIIREGKGELFFL